MPSNGCGNCSIAKTSRRADERNEHGPCQSAPRRARFSDSPIVQGLHLVIQQDEGEPTKGKVVDPAAQRRIENQTRKAVHLGYLPLRQRQALERPAGKFKGGGLFGFDKPCRHIKADIHPAPCLHEGARRGQYGWPPNNGYRGRIRHNRDNDPVVNKTGQPELRDYSSAQASSANGGSWPA